jgi:hypothetical protein
VIGRMTKHRRIANFTTEFPYFSLEKQGLIITDLIPCEKPVKEDCSKKNKNNNPK